MNPDPASLIADCGQPHWPGWQLLMAALLVALAFAAVQAAADPFVRMPRGRANSVRVVRTTRLTRDFVAPDAHDTATVDARKPGDSQQQETVT